MVDPSKPDEYQPEEGEQVCVRFAYESRAGSARQGEPPKPLMSWAGVRYTLTTTRSASTARPHLETRLDRVDQREVDSAHEGRSARFRC